jgi:MFS family permease
MCAGQAIAGVAFGAAFTASLRLVFPLAPEHERAAVVAALYTVSYLAFGIPIVIAGQLTAPLGVVPTVSLYAAVTVILAAASLFAQFRLARSPSRVAQAGFPLGTGIEERRGG